MQAPQLEKTQISRAQQCTSRYCTSRFPPSSSSRNKRGLPAAVCVLSNNGFIAPQAWQVTSAENCGLGSARDENKTGPDNGCSGEGMTHSPAPQYIVL
ncbi:hypothetical protein V2G26_006611 [Clonostachys chloroleuca]